MIMDHSVIVIGQNTKIDCENNFGLKKDIKKLIGTKETNQKKKKTQTCQELHGPAITYIHR